MRYSLGITITSSRNEHGMDFCVRLAHMYERYAQRYGAVVVVGADREEGVGYCSYRHIGADDRAVIDRIEMEDGVHRMQRQDDQGRRVTTFSVVKTERSENIRTYILEPDPRIKQANGETHEVTRFMDGEMELLPPLY